MGREVRKVPADWQHPKDEHGRDVPLMDDYSMRKQEWLAMLSEKGLQETLDYFGDPPNKEEYMPDWPEAERTHFMMYENVSEGTPISPAFETPEELARWLADNNASAFADQSASYEAWLRMAKGGYAPSAIYTHTTGLISGVEGLKEEANDVQGR